MTFKFKLMCTIVLSAGLPLLASEHEAGGNPQLFLWKVVNALIFFGGLAFILRKPVSEFFTNRQRDIRDSLSRAEQSRKDAAQKLREIDELTSNLDKEVKDFLAQVAHDVAAEKARLITQAEEEAVRIGEQARKEIENMSLAAKTELRRYMAELAVREAEAVIAKSISDDERKALFANFSARLEAKS